LADDSGLEVDALGGAPGVLSARYAGESASDAERIEKLLLELSSNPVMKRSARFVSAVVIGRWRRTDPGRLRWRMHWTYRFRAPRVERVWLRSDFRPKWL